MKRKKIFSVAIVGFFSLLLVAGLAVAAVFPEDNTFTGTVNSFEKGIKIGKQGTGGVTFFNGTIVNNTTKDGVDNPVAFGDNIRIDGELWRGEKSGPGEMPVKINDDLTVAGEISSMAPAGAMGADAAPVKIVGGLSIDGDLRVDTGIVRYNEPQKLSIPAAAFTPEHSDESSFRKYENQGHALQNTDYETTRWFTAPIYLPNGVKISKVTINYEVNSLASKVIEAYAGYHKHGEIDSPGDGKLYNFAYLEAKSGNSVSVNPNYVVTDDKSYIASILLPTKYGDGISKFYEMIIEYN